MPRHIILLGPPASGKGTQAKRIAKKFGLPTLGTGNLLRQAIEDGTDLGTEASHYINKGLYVPDELIEALVADWTMQHSAGWVFDGFPRTRAQADFMGGDSGITQPDIVIGLEVPVGELERRIDSRRQCRDCDTVTNTFVHSGPSCPEPQCKGVLYARNDDAIDSFRVRYQQYQTLTAPLFELYRNQGKLYLINGAQDPQSVFNDVEVALDKIASNSDRQVS
jgi:adenylate kinase